MVYKQPTSANWWYKFVWNGQTIRESTKQTNKRVAEQMEAARRTALAKGEVGIKDKKPVPTLSEFAERDFIPYVETTSAGKPNTVRFYKNSINNLKSDAKLAGLRMDAITSEHIAAYVAKRKAGDVEVSTVNRDLAALRRMFHLAQEWHKVTTVLPRVKLLSGENRRERVLTHEEETAYLNAAAAIGNELTEDYQRALTGIRAVQRGQQPRTPDAFLLRDVAAILVDCALRPEECFRLRWADNIRDGAIEIHTGKGRGSRRRIPARAWDSRNAPGRWSSGWLGIPCGHKVRAHGSVHDQEATRTSACRQRSGSVRPLHAPTHLHYPVGQAHRPVHAPRHRGPHGHEHHQAVRSP
jgi:integrase